MFSQEVNDIIYLKLDKLITRLRGIMKILVTGGAGYIGSHTIKELIRQGYKIVVYDNLSDGHKEALPKEAKLVVADLANISQLDKTIRNEKPEAVIHFAGSIQVGESVKNPGKYYINNFFVGINLLEMMVKHHLKYLVYSSSAGVYGNPDRIPIKEDDAKNPVNTYGRTKLMFENALQSYEAAYGLKYVALRYFNAAGASSDGSIGEDHYPETHIIPLIISTALGKHKEFKVFGNDYPTPDGTCIRDYIHVEDLAAAHDLALQYLLKGNQSNIFNLGIGKGFSNKELINAVKKISGQNFKVAIGSRRAGDPARLVANSQKAQKLLKWQPKYVKIEDIIKTAWNWHCKNPQGFAK